MAEQMLPEDDLLPPDDQADFWDFLREPEDEEPPDVGDQTLFDAEVTEPPQAELFDLFAPDDVSVQLESVPAEMPSAPAAGEPASAWARYLASLKPDPNPDVAEDAFRARAAALGLVDARFIGIEYQDAAGKPTGYSVDCIEVYETGGRYLEIARFEEALEAAAFYHELQEPVDRGEVGAQAVHDFAAFAAREQHSRERWQEAAPEHLDIYGWYAEQGRSLAVGEPEEKRQPEPAFNALSAIGLEAADFDPDRDPAPFYDPETGTAYWVGVFQPDMDAPEHCVASILSLGRNLATGELEAQIAPCVPGDWDKAYGSSQHLLNVMQRDGLEACFLAAESMAIATDQRDLWESERGMALEQDYAQQAAEYTRETWELDL
jgi:hypothetical protein